MLEDDDGNLLIEKLKKSIERRQQRKNDLSVQRRLLRMIRYVSCSRVFAEQNEITMSAANTRASFNMSFQGANFGPNRQTVILNADGKHTRSYRVRRQCGSRKDNDQDRQFVRQPTQDEWTGH
jgi:hypothetical protein